VWCRRFSPVVGVEDANTPECLLINIEGVAHLFNNERAMARHVLEELQNVKLYARVAIADTVGLAWAVAHYGTAASRQSKQNTPVIVPQGEAQQTLQSLPTLALRLPDDVMETLNELDLRRVNQLLNLPKTTLPSRFGDILHKRIYQALGEIAEPITPELPPKQTIQRWRFEYTISDRRVIEMGIQRLLTRTIAALESERHGVQRLHILLQGELGELTDFNVGLMRPSISHSHLMRLIRTQLERVRTPDDICEISVELISSAPLDPRQETLFACRDEAKARREREQLLERISSRLGENAVVAADAVPDAQPERAFQYGAVTNHTERPALEKSTNKPPVTSPPFGGEVGLSGPGEGAAHTQQTQRIANPKRRGNLNPLPRLKPRPLPQAGEVTDSELAPMAQTVLQRPVNLRTDPKPIDVITLAVTGPPTSVRWNGRSNPISKCWGPERVHTGWWRDENIVRDYYRVETDQGLRLWIFRNMRNGEWFLHGVFD
jgi:protein ImuB